MSRIQEAFQNKKAFIPFLTAGDPSMEATVRFILKMAEAGADLIEIGIPFSDPTAEGPVIQNASLRALKGGMTTDKAFDIVRRVREKSQIPLVFMTYLNPVFHYGYEAFFLKCKQLGVSGIILPDLPFEEKAEVETVAQKYGVDVISMISPASEERIEKIAASAKGFLYVVSSMGVTGVRTEIHTDLESMIAKIRKVSGIPCAVGFGISTQEQAGKMAGIADGVIVGSAIVRLIEEYGEEAEEKVYKYVLGMKGAVKEKSMA